MPNYITVDGGTTNTRISLVQNGKITDVLKFAVGASKGIEDSGILKTTIRCGIEDILKKNNLKGTDICQILMSGMLISEYGIFYLEHTAAPAGLEELHDASKQVVLNEISDIPITFLCGVKKVGSNFEDTDLMRGEETELMGLCKRPLPESVYILPGSHSKAVLTDDRGKMTDFSTFLTGEMIFALAKNTILKSAVDLTGSELNVEYLFKGYDFAEEHGINGALFKVRILKNVFGKNADEVYGFFVGAVLHGEVSQILKLNVKRIIIGGQKQLKKALYMLIKAKFDGEITLVSDKGAEDAPALGMIKIFEYKKTKGDAKK